MFFRYLFIFLLLSTLNSFPSPEKEGIDAVKQFVKVHLKSGLNAFRNSGKQRLASPESWASDVIYSIQVDRFNNGDSSNDGENLPPFQNKESKKKKKNLTEFR